MFSLELDFKEFLLSETTIAQQLRNPKFAPLDVVKDVKDNLKTVLDRQPLFQGKAELSHRFANYFTYWGLHHYATETFKNLPPSVPATRPGVPQASLNVLFGPPKTASEGRSQIVGWVLNQSRRWLQDWGDYIAAHFTDNRIQSQFNNLAFTPEMVDEAVKEWHYKLSLKKRVPGGEGWPILELDNLGARWKGWKWLSLRRATCEEEAEAGGHCGNSDYQEGDNILSLRDPQNLVHLTFVVNNKILREMKGYANNKPSKKFHPAIIALLQSEYVGSVAGGGYLPENNFMLSDLDKETREKLIKKKPYLGEPFKYLISTAKSNHEILGRLESIFPNTILTPSKICRITVRIVNALPIDCQAKNTKYSVCATLQQLYLALFTKMLI